jgi:hypothetical protein
VETQKCWIEDYRIWDIQNIQKESSKLYKREKEWIITQLVVALCRKLETNAI